MTTTAPLRSPQELYNDWERNHWAAQDIDLSRDADQWRALGGNRARAPLLGAIWVEMRSSAASSACGLATAAA